jgi:CelD/BcsL family acetyltransferase involved in cellulose biosynthesis
MTLRAEVLTDGAAFDAVAGEWDALVLGSARPTPFVLHGWLRAWWSLYRPESPMRCILVRDDAGTLVGGLPVAITRRGPVRVGELAGALALGDLLVAGADRTAVAAEAARALAREPLDVVDFDGLAAGSVLATSLPGRRRLAEAIAAPTMDMPDGWEAAYQRATSSKTRNTHRRRLKQLAQSGDVAFVRHESEADVATALEDAFRLHALRWEGRPDTSPFGTPDGQAYHRAALRSLSAQGYVRLLELRLDDVPIAFHLYLLVGGAMFVYRLAFDPAFGQFSPGLLTTLEAIRQASEEGATRVEFLRGDERYKLELADRSDPLVRLVGLPSGIRGRAYMESVAGATALRSRLRHNERLRQAVRRARGFRRQPQAP